MDTGRESNEAIKELLGKLLENGKDPDRIPYDNILLVGLTGAGKSSLLCTLNAALTGTYVPWIKSGKGAGQTKTIKLIRFKNCGLKLSKIDGNENESILRELLPTLPTFFDFAGLPDVNSTKIRKILYLVIHGFIPPGTTFSSLENIIKDNGEDVGALDVVFSGQRSKWKISTVVFVHSSRVTVPENLIDCLMSVLKEPNPETSTSLYEGDFFLVLTKQDLENKPLNSDIEDGSLEVLQASSTQEMSNYQLPSVSPQNDVDDIERTLAVKLDIQGSLEYSRVKLCNYSDDNGYKYNPEIVKQHLTFLSHMTKPRLPEPEPQVMLTPKVKLMLLLRRIYMYAEQRLLVNIPFPFVIIAVIAIAVLLFLSVMNWISKGPAE